MIRPARLLASATLVTSLACAKSEPAPPPAPPGPPAAVQVVATDFAFVMPDTLTAGPTTFTLVNNGAELHHLQIVRLEEGKTAADLASVQPGTPPPAWMVFLGGPNAAVPGGGQVRGTVDLTPGSYVMICLIPSPAPDMRPHLMKGMMRPFTVVPTTEQRVAAEAHFTVTLDDYSYAFSAPIPAGEHDVKVVNAGPQAHEVLFLKLAPGKNASDMMKWFAAGMTEPPPGEPIGGTSAISPNGVNIIHANFTPGEYALYCFVEDIKDHKMHIEHGMVHQFTVQ